MAPLGFMSIGVNILTKSFSLLSSASRERCGWAINGAKALTTYAGGPPKRPLNGYMRFVQQQRPQVLRQHPDVKATDVIKQIATRWRQLSADQKQPFERAALVDMNQYKVALERYKAALTPAQSQAIEEEERQKRDRRKAIRRKRELNSLGKPKRPRVPFNIFMSEHFEGAQGTTLVAKMKSLQDDWRRLSNLKKQVYVQLAEDDKVRYTNEMKRWEQRMVRMGRDDLIRRKPAGRKTANAAKKVAESKNAKPKKVVAKKKKVVKKTLTKATAARKTK
ncbi:transcription factor A, mitochondrial-like [Engraulis encrasicolus]|uniref:transcription factor A, mitochondrial-like n=1 Tax=Engraulis encrasicolus TaxID=184585 RepID=UPI002FCF5898